MYRRVVERQHAAVGIEREQPGVGSRQGPGDVAALRIRRAEGGHGSGLAAAVEHHLGAGDLRRLVDVGDRDRHRGRVGLPQRIRDRHRRAVARRGLEVERFPDLDCAGRVVDVEDRRGRPVQRVVESVLIVNCAVDTERECVVVGGAGGSNRSSRSSVFLDGEAE